MGGAGSGGWYRFNKKDAAEDVHSVDVRSWQRQNLLRPGTSFTTTWTGSTGHYLASIGVRSHVGGVVLSYSWGSGKAAEDIRYAVQIERTACNFGGSRPWFICPGSVGDVPCGRRVAVLYNKGRYFLCRSCQDLTYASRQETKGYAALHACQRIRRKLGGSANMTKPFPSKPSGMHHRTYWRMFLEYEKASQAYTRYVLADVEAMNGRLSRFSR